jgi:GT2 family glycosyltransferase
MLSRCPFSKIELQRHVSSGTHISIVLPTYNRAYCLGETLQSIQSQTYTNWEVLVIDDGSTDRSADVVRDMQKHDTRIKYHYQRNGGVCAARNAGLRIARGDWIAFLDSDDAWLPWKLAAQAACMERLPEVGMIWTDMIGVTADGTVVSDNYLRRFYSAYRRIGEERIFQHARSFAELAPELSRSEAVLRTAVVRWGDVYSSMIVGNLVHTSTVLIRRERARAVGLFDERYRTGEDYDFHLRTCYEGPVALLDAPSIRYRVAGGDDQLTATQYRSEIARNGLATRLAAIRRDPARISLPPRALRTAIARAHAMVADELFESGELAAARPHFARSIPAIWRSPRMVSKALVASLPVVLARRVRQLARGRGN